MKVVAISTPEQIKKDLEKFLGPAIPRTPLEGLAAGLASASKN
jgi:hypothetical protein